MLFSRSRISKEAVIWGYRLLLGREPESAAVVRNHRLSHLDTTSFVKTLMESLEFRSRHPESGAHLIDKWVMVHCPMGFDLWLNLCDTAVSWSIIADEFEAAEITLVESLVRAGATCLDIGANIGLFSMLMGRCVGRSGRVIGFEPHPLLVSFARKSAAQNNFSQCVFNECALGDCDGDVNLLSAVGSANQGASQVHLGDAPSNRTVIRVPMRRLCDFDLPKIDFIKIDVEGAEHMVLRSFCDRLVAERPVILSELSPLLLPEISGVSDRVYVRLIESIGYDCIDIASGQRFAGYGDRIFANVAFMPR
jgi:FkbM family methyltransferase